MDEVVIITPINDAVEDLHHLHPRPQPHQCHACPHQLQITHMQGSTNRRTIFETRQRTGTSDFPCTGRHSRTRLFVLSVRHILSIRHIEMNKIAG